MIKLQPSRFLLAFRARQMLILKPACSYSLNLIGSVTPVRLTFYHVAHSNFQLLVQPNGHTVEPCCIPLCNSLDLTFMNKPAEF